MTDPRPFDERFAEAVRETFDAYEEPVAEAALGRLQAALGGQGAAHAPDRPAARGSRRRFRVAALAVLLLAVSAVWMLTDRPVGNQVASGPVPSAEAPSLSVPAEVPAPSGRQPTASRPAPAASVVRGTEAARLGPTAGGVPAGSAPSRVLSASVDAPTERVPLEVPGVSVDSVDRDTWPEPSVEARPPTASVVIREARDRPRIAELEDSDRLPAMTRPAMTRPAMTRPTMDRSSGPGVVVVASAASAVARRDVTGGGLVLGVGREWTVAPRLALSGGLAAAYTEVDVRGDSEAAVFALNALDSGRADAVDVSDRIALTTLALEVPLGAVVDLVRTRGGRVRASAGLTSAVYLAQTIRDEGQTLVRRTVLDPSPDGPPDGQTIDIVVAEPFEMEQRVSPGRVEVGRLLDLGLRYEATSGLGVEAFARVPLGGVTSREVPVGSAGVRVRLGLR
ncbi:MAG: hypothetical protein AAF791_07540 [Bacteroidota bacterium]